MVSAGHEETRRMQVIDAEIIYLSVLVVRKN